jgi:hypothetical protein
MKDVERYGHTGEWAVENGMKINHGKMKARKITKSRVKNPICNVLVYHKILERRSCKQLGIILRSDFNWVDQIIYRVPKAWKAVHFLYDVLKKEKGIHKI